jgi:D-glycero-alpha-D-manno-heptose-7-phosphate kinase
MIISRTPFRISFFGGGTDFPDYYREHGGRVLATTIDKYAYLSVHRLSPFFTHNFRASYAQTESVLHPQEFQHPLIRECLLHLGVQEGVEIAHVSDLPGRTGLGTSSSFTVGLLHALHAFRGEAVAAAQLAREAIVVERERVGDSGGHQDQYAAAYGGLVRIDFSGDQEVQVTPVQVAPQQLAALQSHLLLFFLGTEQSAETLLQEQTRRTQINQPALDRLSELVVQAQALLEECDDLNNWGRLLHESWGVKKSLANGISNPVLDQAYDAARSAGALGGKVLGAGGRGFLLVFADPALHATIRERLAPLPTVSFRFSPEGSRIIFCSDDA